MISSSGLRRDGGSCSSACKGGSSRWADACASVDGAERLDEEPVTNLQRLLLVNSRSLRAIGEVITVWSNGKLTLTFEYDREG